MYKFLILKSAVVNHFHRIILTKYQFNVMFQKQPHWY